MENTIIRTFTGVNAQYAGAKDNDDEELNKIISDMSNKGYSLTNISTSSIVLRVNSFTYIHYTMVFKLQ